LRVANGIGATLSVGVKPRFSALMSLQLHLRYRRERRRRGARSIAKLMPHIWNHGPINTNIARGARDHPDHMVGDRSAPMKKRCWPNVLATTGLAPKKVGERVVDAIPTKTFYAFVSAVPADVIKARHRRIEEALNSPRVTQY
jgi:hypothetical protein